MPKVSIIIPCYNSGEYLDEAVESVKNQTFKDVEIIIVNDGSTDVNTIEQLKKYYNTDVKVINTDNQGVSQARNTGIKEAGGEYILPLDSDDKIHPEYVESAVKILDENLQIGICYCEAEFFGDIKGKWNLPKFELKDFLARNCIFCTAMYRKSAWEKVGGYKKEMDKGFEDWEFWLSLIEAGGQVHRIPKILFYYRQSEFSRSANSANKNLPELIKKIVMFHPKLYAENLEYLLIPWIDIFSKSILQNSKIYRIKAKMSKKFNILVMLEKR
ncbi:MAG TPA: glycosyltransferase [Candidatus Gastranaerophilaceae bacterium]|nr:glycosyltransferase [Candidatus Gastranaerophilaceae bacterium]HPT40892.1 glycosyltransferase [Candidatus Gastranaerophilaceae bacterium]